MQEPLFTSGKFIESERLLFRPPALDDATKLFALYTHDPEVTKYLVWKTNETMAETEAFLKHVLEEWPKDHEYHFILEKKETHQPIGMFATTRKEPGVVEFGYVIARSEWGKGFVTEAVKAALEYLFHQTDTMKVQIYCDAENKASERVMQKAGLKFLKQLPKFSLHPNISEEKRDCVLYGVSREEF